METTNSYAGYAILFAIVLGVAGMALFPLLARGAHHLFYSFRSNLWRAICSGGFVLAPTVGPFLAFGQFEAWFGFFLPTIAAVIFWTALFFLLSKQRTDRALVTMSEERGGFQKL